MKCRFPAFFAVIIFISSGHCLAQTSPGSEYYTFEKSYGTYVTMDTAAMQSVNQGDVWVEDTTYNIPIGFTFRFLDHDLTEIGINQVNLFLPQRSYYITAFGNFLMYDRGNDHGDSISLSPINYLLDSLSGTKILKIQWLNAGFFFDTTMYMNLQIWLYQGSNNIEIHYGKSHINLNKSQVHGCGPLVGLAKLDTLTGAETYEFYLAGISQYPRVVTLKDAGARCLEDIPAEGMVYRFVFHDSSIVAPKTYPADLMVYPDPSTGKLNLDLPGPEQAGITIYDMTGRKMVSTRIPYGTALDLSALKSGMYHITVNQGAHYYYSKFMIIR